MPINCNSTCTVNASVANLVIPRGFFFGRYGPRRLRLQLSVPTKLIETNKHKKTAVKQRSELLNYLLQHADFVSSGCSATRRKFLSATQQK